MILRDILETIDFTNKNFRWCSVPLADSTLYIERNGETFDAWVLPGYRPTLDDCVEHYEGERELLRDGDEFEAQMLLDHYVTNVGVVAK